MSPRRLAAIGLAATCFVGVATVLGQMVIASALAVGGVGALLWGWWPEIRSRVKARQRQSRSYGLRFRCDHPLGYRCGEVGGFSADKAIEFVEAGEAEFLRRRDRHRAIEELSSVNRGDWTLQLDYRLRLHEEEAGLTPEPSPSQGMTIRDWLPKKRNADYKLTARLHMRAEIDPPALQVECSKPIYDAMGFRQDSRDGEPVFNPEPVRRDQTRMLFRFGDTPLPRGGGVLLLIYTMEPAHLTRVAVAKAP